MLTPAPEPPSPKKDPGMITLSMSEPPITDKFITGVIPSTSNKPTTVKFEKEAVPSTMNKLIIDTTEGNDYITISNVITLPSET